MSSSMSPIPNLTYGTRLLRIAEKMGFRGEGAVNIPIMDSIGHGTTNVVVSQEPLVNAPIGTIVMVASRKTFVQAKLTEDGAMAWADLGNAVNLEEVIAETGPTRPIALKPLPPPPDPNAEDTSFITEPLVGINATAPDHMRTASGTMKHGSGNDANNMVVATNGEISIAAGVRFYRKGASFPADTYLSGAVYDVNVANSEYKSQKDWSWIYAIGLDNTANGKNIAALYDVTMVVTNMANGRKLNFVAKFDDDKPGVFRMFDSRNDLDIVDNTTDADGSMCQNIQRVTFYTARLHSEISQINKAPIGEYQFRIEAKRKRGDFAPVVVEFQASVIDNDMSMIVDPTTAANRTLNAVALKANGQLIHSSGNLAGQMIVTSNGEVELAGAVRWYRNGTYITPAVVDGIQTYSLNLQDAPNAKYKDWTWVYSLALTNTLNSMRLTDVYDVTLHVTSEGGEVLFTGSFADNIFHLVSEEHGLDIVDNTTTMTGQVCQNIQRIEFYADALLPELGANTGKPVGEYLFELRAKRKIGDVRDVVCQWRALVVDELPPPPPPAPVVEPESETVVENDPDPVVADDSETIVRHGPPEDAPVGIEPDTED